VDKGLEAAARHACMAFELSPFTAPPLGRHANGMCAPLATHWHAPLHHRVSNYIKLLALIEPK